MDRQVGRSSASVFTAWAPPHRQLDGGRSKHRHAPARKGVFRKARGSAFGKVIKNGLAQSKAEKKHYNKVLAARTLGISRSKLYRKLREHGLLAKFEAQ